ncbi:hypothetical protein COLO4_23680 [Corchorus olitorius]|uniref:HAT C-terminal dimerisation domain-containing protein n=1 Tax=Corchorus olitorius TaxID=93759 RepID=A0A1R3IFA8_9ROSI|nr:hypothetical protein COLO4_23680 [Corchorus olitorius]
MARDILAIPITTVASEATFSAGSRVIDTYRASLSPESVQILLCAGDWCRNLHGVKKRSKKRKEVNGNYSSNMEVKSKAIGPSFFHIHAYGSC